MIISASRRTDIPTYYSEWFENRVKDGYLLVRNPMNAHQVSRISLSPEVVDCIVFWTKNPIPMLGRLPAFDAYPYYFQYTLTGYGSDMERNLPDKKEKLIPAFRELAGRIGADRMVWRYDPIVFTSRYTPQYHLKAFSQIAEALDGCTGQCVISFVDIYQKNRKNMEETMPVHLSEEELTTFCAQLVHVAGAHGMTVATCAEVIDLESVGIRHNACIDPAMIERITGCSIKVKKDPSQRQECGCAASIDIGTYNTCANGCRYCYANFSEASVQENLRRYDPASPMLCDSPRPDDKINDRPMKSLLDRQLSLF